MTPRRFPLLLVALLLIACTARDPKCDVEPLAYPIVDFEGLTAGESVEFTARLVKRSVTDKEELEEELVFDVDGQSRQLTWTLPRKLSIDLTEGQQVEVLIRKTMGFEGSATGIRIRDEAGIVLLADDGVYGNGLRPSEMEPFSFSQEDAGCRNRANRPGELNNFFLAVEGGGARVELMHGSQGDLEVDGHTYSVLVVESTARIDDVQWTDAPYSHQAFVIARTQRDPRARSGLAQTLPPVWELAWADEFDGSVIDPTSWTSVVMPDPHNEELQYYTNRVDAAPGANAWVEDGALVIEARRENFEHRAHTSARLNTKGKREFRYGRFEARIRQPAAVGMWPAFWLLGANIDEVGWPRCGEIDIMEGKGRLSDWTSGAIHRGPDWANNRITAAEFRIDAGSFHDEWHVFAVEWEPERIRWYVDGVEFQTTTKTPSEDPAYWPFDEGHSFYVILNLAVGGWFDQPYMPPDDLSPQRLYVDYVRVYRRTADR